MVGKRTKRAECVRAARGQACRWDSDGPALRFFDGGAWGASGCWGSRQPRTGHQAPTGGGGLICPRCRCPASRGKTDTHVYACARTRACPMLNEPCLNWISVFARARERRNSRSGRRRARETGPPLPWCHMTTLPRWCRIRSMPPLAREPLQLSSTSMSCFEPSAFATRSGDAGLPARSSPSAVATVTKTKPGLNSGAKPDCPHPIGKSRQHLSCGLKAEPARRVPTAGPSASSSRRCGRIRKRPNSIASEVGWFGSILLSAPQLRIGCFEL